MATFAEDVRARPSALGWYLLFIVTGWGLGNNWAFLDLHAGPALPLSFLTCTISFWCQFIVGGLCGLWTQGRPAFSFSLWNRKMLLALLASAAFDGGSQALDYVAKVDATFMVYTVFHSSVVFFSALIAVAVLKAKVGAVQWAGVALVVLGVWVPAVPFPKEEAGDLFAVGLICALFGSAFLAASYPFSEMVFGLQGRRDVGGQLSEEVACCYGSTINAVAYSVWFFAYTVPRWDEVVVQPIYNSPQPSVPLAVAGYLSYGLIVGLHSLSFWKCVSQLGTVATAVSKGLQQAGNFVIPSLIFCSQNQRECLNWNFPPEHASPGQLTWSQWQRPIAAVLCTAGVVVFALGKNVRKSLVTAQDDMLNLGMSMQHVGTAA